jgi:hypothetical protein
MAQITSYPFLRHFRADASSYVQQFENGHRVRSGRGLAFWFRPGGTSISEIPMDDQQLPYILSGHSADYQELTVYGTVIWRVATPDVALQRRTMVQASLDDGQSLAALNELFLGHRSHQSARYLLRDGEAEEFQSSSGVIVSTGTGLSGWARSIMTATHRQETLAPDERHALYFAREPWPSRQTGSSLAFGAVEPEHGISLTSRMNDGGVIFADGIEQDYLRFDWGLTARIELSKRTLNLVRDYT